MQNPKPQPASNFPAAPGRWAKIRDVVTTFGVFNGVLYGLDRWLDAQGRGRRIVHYRLMAQPVPEGAAETDLPGDVAVRAASAGDPVLKELPIDDAVLSYRFDQDATCLVVSRGGSVLGCFWLTLGPYMEDEVRCRFVPEPEGRAAWDFDVYVPPAHRLGRAFLRVWQAAFAHLRAHGKAWSMSRISAFNTRSLASHRALGAVPVGRAIFVKGVRWQLLVTNRAPFIHLSGGTGGVPTIRVRPPKARGG